MIPEYDDEIEWRAHKDRAPRRRVISSRPNSPASQDNSIERPAVRNVGKQIRQMSISSDDEMPTKKRKDDGSMDSCERNDLIQAMERVDEDLNRTH